MNYSDLIFSLLKLCNDLCLTPQGKTLHAISEWHHGYGMCKIGFGFHCFAEFSNFWLAKQFAGSFRRKRFEDYICKNGTLNTKNAEIANDELIMCIFKVIISDKQ